MGGVVESVVSGVGDIGQGVISGVDQALTGIDDALPQEAKIAAAIYLASQGLPVGAEGSALSGANAAVAADNAYLASQALTPAQAAAAAAGSVEASQLAGLTSSGSGLLSGAGNLAGSALDWAKANPLSAAGLGLTAAKALGGSGTTSTSSSSVDPDVKAAYLRNLEEARATAAGLGPKQFAAFPEYNLGMVQKYMNPYESKVVQNTLADIERARQGQISAEGAQATAAKAFGGSRQAVTRSLVDEAALRNAGNLAAQLRQQGFTQAQNLGLSQEALRQQYEQQRLDAARNLGLERLGVSQGALSLQPTAGTQSAPLYTNQATSALGGALGGAKLGSLIGGEKNPDYALYGAGLGGLLGFL